MTKRILAKDTPNEAGNEVLIKGFVQARRDHGKLLFIDLRDRSGLIQVVFNPRVSEKAYEAATVLRPEFAVAITGNLKARPEKLINPKLVSGTVELEATDLEILAEAETLPFDMGGEELNLELPTLLDHRSLTLRHQKVKAIFRIENVILDAFREFMVSQDFFEFQAPSIIPAIPEGGAEVFEVKYFEHKAFLAQSPQLYKQILVGAFERVFTVNKVFRSEPSVTTRHLAEIVCLDAEMGFIDSWKDVEDMAAETITFILKEVGKKCKDELEIFGATVPQVGEKIPSIKLRDAQQIIFERTKRDHRHEKDLDPEDEREICRWALEDKGSDLVFISHYPTKSRPFYTYPDEENPDFNQGFDLLGRGVEWLTGGRRINDHQTLLSNAKEWGIDSNKIRIYLDAFKYGMPPEGGFSFGLERITMKLLELGNVREASLFPRDMERVDERFSITEEKEKSIQEKK